MTIKTTPMTSLREGVFIKTYDECVSNVDKHLFNRGTFPATARGDPQGLALPFYRDKERRRGSESPFAQEHGIMNVQPRSSDFAPLRYLESSLLPPLSLRPNSSFIPH